MKHNLPSNQRSNDTTLEGCPHQRGVLAFGSELAALGEADASKPPVSWDDVTRAGAAWAVAGAEDLAKFAGVGEGLHLVHVPGVFAEVGGDAVGTGFFAEAGEFHGVGLNVREVVRAEMRVAGLPKGCTVVDVYAEEHGEGLKSEI